MCIKPLTSFLCCIAFISAACSTGHCRRDSQEVLEKLDPKPPTGYEQENLGSITVVKSDGSKQCGMRDGIPLDDMAESQLKGIQILSSEKKHDGLLRIQSCGASTGMMNAYEIRHQDLRKAQKAGFTILKKTAESESN
jgi:hypothetical protein